MPIRIDRLLELIPSETESLVKRTRDALNTTIREGLRRQTGLRLRVGPGRSPSGEGSQEGNIRVRLVPGLPQALIAKELPDDRWLAALLATKRATLTHLRDSAKALSAAFPEILQNPSARLIVAGREQHLPPVEALAEDLLKEAGKFDLVKWILEVDEDVLGAYFYGKRDLFGGDGDSRIELYWGVIGLMAGLLGVATQDLTVVVLTHELAHAYTHRGADIDGLRWGTPDFATSERGLVEGLAQYYTQSVTDHLGLHALGSRAAFEALLRHQPPAYHTHEKWVSEFRPEEVRLAMIETRRMGKSKTVDFEARLVAARVRLRGQAT